MMGGGTSAGAQGSGNGAMGAGTPGTAGWVTVTLPAGNYELVCNLPNHYVDGMYQELVVTNSSTNSTG
jgi:Sulfocyanin (SoxE) domain